MSIAANIAAHLAEIDGDPSYPAERKALWLARLADAKNQEDSSSMISPELKEYLAEHYGLPDDADEGQAKKMGRQLVREKKLTIAQYGDLCAGRAYDNAIDAAGEKYGRIITDRLRIEPDSEVQPSDIFKGSSSNMVDVKAPSARYSEKRYTGKHVKSGEPVVYEGRPVELPSEKDNALAGVYFKNLARRKGVDIVLNEHEQTLLKKLYNDNLWVGDAGGSYWTGNKLSDIFRTKGSDLIADGTSGGTSLVPYFFDTDIITFPLLNSELFPFVTTKDLSKSNQVKTASLGNLTAAWSATEGSAGPIALQTTDALVAGITSNIYDVAMAISIGRDFLSDSPVEVGSEITRLMGQRLSSELDKVIATGDGTTQPQGLTNASGIIAVTAKNSTAGPFMVSDVENMISSLPKQYRSNEPSICWVMSDSTWFKLRGIAVNGTTDQRRIFGYDYEKYTLASRPVRISNDLPATDMYFLKLALYRMWRRLGLQITMSTEGKTLMLDNEMLIVARGRFGGRLMDPGGCCAMANAPLH